MKPVKWRICHKSGRRLFETRIKEVAENRRAFGWVVVPVYAEFDTTPAQFEALARKKE